ncbi:hypothetical protein [Burkholderia sp. ABCPW 14]|uniref:hypothetical protein n=1 Tax=Burkholderia sp. ABCPW 14 TaxID=1637860 RepID=UPI0012E3EC9F|nr:hypothetical protein [Burkholderia sp. ABCPW 14]
MKDPRLAGIVASSAIDATGTHRFRSHRASMTRPERSRVAHPAASTNRAARPARFTPDAFGIDIGIGITAGFAFARMAARRS